LIEDSPKRIFVKSTERRIAIVTELDDQAGIDRSDLLNNLIYDWVIQQVDPDLQQPIKEIFGY
jgi:hypothetical protein